MKKNLGIIICTTLLAIGNLFAQNDTVKIDCGSDSRLTKGNWNDFVAFNGSDTLEFMINSLGDTTSLSIYVSDPFSGTNSSGTTTPDASLGFDPNATSDSFYGNSVDFGGLLEPTGGLTLEGLEPGKTYSFTFFGSRNSTDNRETKYKVIGSTSDSANINVSGNDANVAVISDIKPDNNGKILIEVSPGPNNDNPTQFYYIGVVQIVYETPVPDAISPSVPTGLTAGVVTDSTIAISWTASTDNNNVTGYNVYRDNMKVATVYGTTYEDLGLIKETQYKYLVEAFDFAGNISDKSDTLKVTAVSDTVAPGSPLNLAAVVLSNSTIKLSWSSSSDNIGVTGYNIYRDDVKINTTTDTTYVDTVNVSVTYTYQIEAFDLANNVSDKSSSVEIGILSSIHIKEITGLCLYPNPALTDNVTIELSHYNTQSNTVLKILDITGKQVYIRNLTLREVNTKLQLNISNMSRGIYFVTMTNENKSEQIKLIVQ